MGDISTLLLLCLAMLVGCYISGSIPLILTLSEDKLKLVTTMGAGLLIGTALAVIIPEGVHNLYSTNHQHNALKTTRKLLATSLEFEGPNKILNNMIEQSKKHMDDNHDHHDHSHTNYQPEMHTYIGVALVFGFIFMFLIDQLGGKHSHSSDIETSGVLTHNRHNITATLGLVVHAAADGIALGAAATTSERHVETIVFIAIMLHKAPAAFGLVSFLLHEGFDKTRIKKHLAAFSLAAPITAILTYFGLGQGSKEALSDINATGIAMLFSAGTFLYVSTVHVLWELASVTSFTIEADGTKVYKDTKQFSKTQIILMVVGSLLPVIISLNHHH